MKRYVAILAVAVMIVAAPSRADVMTGVAGGGQPHTNMQPSLGVTHIIAVQGTFPSRSVAEGDALAAGLSSAMPFIGEIGLFAGNFAPRGWASCDGQLLPINQNQSLFSILGTTYGGDGRTTFALPDLRGRSVIHEGAGPGLTPRPLGQKTGGEQVTLTEAQLPAHNHALPPTSLMTGPTGGGQAHTTMQPSLALNYIIGLSGLYPSRDLADLTTGDALAAELSLQDEPYVGEVSLFAGNFAPRDWAFCDGQLLTIAQNPALFSLLGTTYGGDGRTTFALPDLRGRTVIHEGAGPGLTPRPLGQKTGVEEVTLTEGQLPGHSHTLPPTTLMTGPTGGGQADTNMQPSLALNYIIALWGIYPSRELADLTTGEALAAELSLQVEPYIGEISLFAGNFAPRNWAFCDGQVLTIAQNQALFSLLGTLYGGDGRTTFALPDLRGRVPIHPGQGPGLTYRWPGERIGGEGVTLTVEELASHDHTVPEPATLALVALGGLGVFMRRRCK